MHSAEGLEVPMNRECIAGVESRIIKRAWVRQHEMWGSYYLRCLRASAHIILFRMGGFAISIYHLNGVYIGSTHVTRSLGDKLFNMLKHIERNCGII